MSPAKFKALRLKLGLTPEQMAQKIFVTVRTVYHYESGDRPVSRQSAKLAHRLLQDHKGGKK